MKDSNKQLEPPAKQKKLPKKNKKAPGLFTKKYKSGQIDKKLFDRIFVEADREYAKSLFVETEDKKGRTWLAVPKDMRFTKKEVARLKLISSDVKSQKGRVKIIALLLTAGIITAAILLFCTFKNTLVKKAIVSGGSAVFGTVCEVSDVSFKPLAGYLSIHNLEIADKKNPWKNAIQIETITSDFDLTMLLQGKFIVEEMSVTGIQTGTDRDTDGTYIPKEKKQKVRKEEKKKEKSDEPSKIASLVAEVSNDMTARFNAALGDLFDQYNPENLINQIYDQLVLPEAVKDAAAFGTDMTHSFQNKAVSLEATAGNVKTKIEDVLALDYKSALKNPLIIKDMYSVVTDAYDTAVTAYGEAKDTVGMITTAATDVQTQYKNLTAAFNTDSKFLNGQVAELKTITVADGFSFIADTAGDLVKATLGEVYDYIEKGLAFIQGLEKEKSPAREKKKPGERLAGRTVTYRNHNEPKVWIKHVEGSGPKLHFTADNISSDEKKAGGPAVLDFNGHELGFVLGKPADGPGLSATAAFDLKTVIHETGSYSVEGNLTFSPFILSAGSFKPAAAAEIVNSVFSRFTETYARFTATSEGFGKKMDFMFTTDMAAGLWNGVLDEWNYQFETIKAKILQEAQAKLQKFVDEAVQSLTGFSNLEASISGYAEKINSYKEMLEQKKNELSDYISSTIDAINDEIEKFKAEAESLLKEAETAITEEAERLKKKAEEVLAEAERLKNEAEEALDQIEQMKEAAVSAVQDEAQNVLAEAERAKEQAEAAVMAELERRQQEVEAELERLRKEAEEQARAAAKAAEDAARAEAERLKQEAAAKLKAAEDAARAEVERLKKEAEEAAKKEAEEAAKKAADAAAKAFKKLW